MSLLLTSVRVVVSSYAALGDCPEVCAIVNDFVDRTECNSFWKAVGDGKCHLLQARLLRGQWTKRSLSCASLAMNAAALHGHNEVVKVMHEKLPRSAELTMSVLKKAVLSMNLQLSQWLYDAGGVCKMSEVMKKKLRVQEVIFNAVRSGSMDMIHWVDKHFKWMSQSSKQAMDGLIEVAASKGFLHVIKWLLSRSSAKLTATAMDMAASNGHLELVKWFHEHSMPGCTTEAMTLAAQNGHLEVVSWLHENRSEGCSDNAMHLAASNGHLDVLKWLHMNRTEACQGLTISSAAMNGHLDVVQWLFENRVEARTSSLVDDAASNGHLHVVVWLHENHRQSCSKQAMDFAAGLGHLDVVIWLHNNRREGCTTRAIDFAAEKGHLAVVQWLHHNRSEGCTTYAMDLALFNCHLEVAKWLYANRTEGYSELGLCQAKLRLKGLTAKLPELQEESRCLGRSWTDLERIAPPDIVLASRMQQWLMSVGLLA